jgi:hypothetical protein
VIPQVAAAGRRRRRRKQSKKQHRPDGRQRLRSLHVTPLVAVPVLFPRQHRLSNMLDPLGMALPAAMLDTVAEFTNLVLVPLAGPARRGWRAPGRRAPRLETGSGGGIPVKHAIPSTAYLTSMDRQDAGGDTRDTE